MVSISQALMMSWVAQHGCCKDCYGWAAWLLENCFVTAIVVAQVYFHQPSCCYCHTSAIDLLLLLRCCTLPSILPLTAGVVCLLPSLLPGLDIPFKHFTTTPLCCLHQVLHPCSTVSCATVLVTVAMPPSKILPLVLVVCVVSIVALSTLPMITTPLS